MPRFGTAEYYRQKRIHFMIFTGFLLVIFYSTILNNRGRLAADISLVVGVFVCAFGLALLVRDRIKRIPPGD